MHKLFLGVCMGALALGASFASAAEPPQTTLAAATVAPPAVQCAGAEAVVYFNIGATALSSDSESALSDMARARRDTCTSHITVTGYTDSTGSVTRNRHLAQQRASAVQTRLIALGVPSEEIAIGSAGETSPQSATEARLNRRVNIAMTASPRAPAIAPIATPTPN
ncbi:MAG: OmpA family protein [Terricaulis silvestris]